MLAVSSGLKAHLDRLPAPALQALEDGTTHQAFLLGPESMQVPMHVVALPLRSDLTDHWSAGGLSRHHLYRPASCGVVAPRAGGRGDSNTVDRVHHLLDDSLGLWPPAGPHDAMAARTAYRNLQPSVSHISEPGEFEPLTREVTRLASSLVAARAAAEEEARLRESAESNWTAERLRVFVQSRLGGDRLFAVSNREPYEHVHTPDGIRCVVPASGLVTALEPVLRACHGTWIAQATGDADDQAVDGAGRVRVPPEHPQYTLRRIWLTPEEERGFYLGFANEGLWPLCHIAHTRPTFRVDDWEVYREVNHKFADAVLEEIAEEQISGGVGAGLSLCACCRGSSSNAARMRASRFSGIFHGPTPKRSASARGSVSCSTVCWARI